jgi:hypothetical protein
MQDENKSTSNYKIEIELAQNAKTSKKSNH